MTNPKYQNSEINDCIVLDQKIKTTQDKIVEMKRKKLGKSWTYLDEVLLNSEIGSLARLEGTFINSSCRNKIEYKRLVDLGEIASETAIKQEKTLLPKNEKEQYVYIGLGAVVILVGLYIISKK